MGDLVVFLLFSSPVVVQVTQSTKVLRLVQRLVEIGLYTPGSAHTVGFAAGAAADTAQGQAHLESAGLGSQQQQQLQLGVSPTASGAAGPAVVKAIVFSQFWMHVQLIGQQLSARKIRHEVLKRDMAARDKQAAVMKFKATKDSCCLVMDESGGYESIFRSQHQQSWLVGGIVSVWMHYWLKAQGHVLPVMDESGSEALRPDHLLRL